MNVSYGVEAVTIDYGLVRLDSGRSKRSKRTMNGFEGTDACLACFEGSRWIQSAVGVNLSSKRAEIGLERFEQSPIRQQLSYACFGGLYGSRRARSRSTAAQTVTETEIPQIMKDSVSCTDWKARNGLEELSLISLS
jgi:hypothetical protein